MKSSTDNGKTNSYQAQGFDKNEIDSQSDNELIVVGIGASAGGLEALQLFFNSMSSVSDISFVVVQHLSPDYKSLMAEILAKHTKMRVVQAENEMELKPNCVYLIPPKNNMIVQNGKLYLKVYTHTGVNHPIDLFFDSLADEKKEKAIAVVLSGTGTDGTSGVKTIKEQGGLVIVQEPSSAKFDGMPRSAITTGMCDFVLPPHKIAEEIYNFVHYPSVSSLTGNLQMFGDEEMLSRIYSILKRTGRVDYTLYKKSTFLRRVERRMVICRKEVLSDYVDFLTSNPDEAKTLCKEILIGVTSFFRDRLYFDTLKTNVIMHILTKSSGDEPIRAWVAGCSTGEEAYSIAILFKECMDELKLHREIKIFATDVDTDAIDVASRGTYSEAIIDDMSQEYLNKYFVKRGNKYTITKDIRKLIIFAPHNIIQDPPFGRLDLISCRNVLIYFQPKLQKQIFATFHNSLKHNGYLFLGKSETINDFVEVFTPAFAVERIFIHNAAGRTPDTVPLAFGSPQFFATQQTSSEEPHEDKMYGIYDDIYPQLLDVFLPACAVINENNEVLHSFGDLYRFLQLPRGKATLNIFNMASESLNLALSTAINKAREENTKVVYTEIPITLDNSAKQTLISLTVYPLTSRKSHELGLIAILFSDEKSISDDVPIEKYDVNKTAAQRIVNLENELQDSHENLKATIGELKTVNEELQAANEELLTANEELQSSNEELQSVNEELYTVNAEYQQKLEELTELNNDMSNFLSSTMIGIIFVDKDMNIRKFTDYVAREFNLLEHDIGRPMHHISHNFKYVNITKDAHDVLRTLVPVEHEVESNDGKYYIMRISPYRTVDNNIKGLVISIIDITENKTAYSQIEKLSYAIEQMPNVVIMADINGVVEYVNPQFTEMTGYTKEEIVGQNVKMLKSYRLTSEEYDVWWNRLKNGETWISEMENRRKDGSIYWERASLLPVPDRDGVVTSMLKVAEDITDLKAASTAGYITKNVVEHKHKRIREKEILDAVNKNEFVPFYQPIVDAKTGNVKSFEALARWKQLDGKVLLPSDFIEEAELSDAIVPLTETILRQACTQAKIWCGLGFQNVKVSVNMSKSLFSKTDLVKVVSEILATTGCKAENVILEFQESIIVDWTNNHLSVLNNLKKLGVDIALDGFGMGYSSFNQLVNLPVDIMKVDRQFLAYSDEDSDSHEHAVKALFAVAEIMGYESVAIGVETEEQRKDLEKYSCSSLQGFLIAEPLPIDESIKMLVDKKGIMKA